MTKLRYSTEIDDLPCDEVTFCAQEKVNSVDNVARLAHAGNGLACQQLFNFFIRHTAQKVSLNWSRSDRVDCDAIIGKLSSKDTRQALDRRLRCSVDRLPFQIKRDSHRRKVDDTSELIFLHQARRFLTKEKRAKDVCLNDASCAVQRSEKRGVHGCNPR